MSEPKSRTWRQQAVTFKNFHDDWKRGIYDLDPRHQRNVVHNDKWKGDIIKSAIQFNDIPLVRFHQRIQSDGTHRWESLDGKQRCSAIIEFMNGDYSIEFSWTGWPKVKTHYKELSAGQKQRIDELNLDMKLLPETLSNEEISQYFQWAQNTKTTSLGEFLNSTLHSQFGEKLNHFISKDQSATDKTKGCLLTALNELKPIGGVDRHQHLEITARLLYSYTCHYKSTMEQRVRAAEAAPELATKSSKKSLKAQSDSMADVDKFTAEQKKMRDWWVAESMPEDEFGKYVNTVTWLFMLLNKTNFKYKAKNNTYLPIYWYLLKHVCDSEGAITHKRANWIKLTRLLNTNEIDFTCEDAGGTEGHDAAGPALTRYRYLCVKMA